LGLEVLFGRAAQLNDSGGADRIATPTGRFHSQPKKLMLVELVFCMMNTSSTIRITNPVISADHSAAARVNFTADSGLTRYSPGVATGSGGTPFPEADGGRSDGTDGSLVMTPSCPFPHRMKPVWVLTLS
jgi:hypothetical protein